MLTQVLITLLLLLLVPGVFVYSLWRGGEKTRLEWLLKAFYTGAFILYIVLAGNWAWLCLYARYLALSLYVLALVISFKRARALPLASPDDRWRYAGGLLTLSVFMGLLALVVRGHFYAGEPVQLSFPLQGGRYLVAQGGSSALLNHHVVSPSQRYALDLVAIDAAGTRASGIYPPEMERYVVFGAVVHSPCDGTVLASVDGLPDHIPPASDREQPAGNHVVIGCAGAEVELAHLRRGSVMVRDRDHVVTGQPLGQVGNSGNTSEPHLHIHAVSAGSGGVTSGEGMPILFDGRFLVRNTVSP